MNLTDILTFAAVVIGFWAFLGAIVGTIKLVDIIRNKAAHRRVARYLATIKR